VLQHTPDVRRSFETIARYPRLGGRLAVDVYNKDYWRNYHTPIYLLRHLTRHLPQEKLYRWIARAMPFLMQVSTSLRLVPGIGRWLSALVPIANYQGLLETDSKELVEQWSVLDTFDTLSPRYISPHSPATVSRWFRSAGYDEVEFDHETVFFMRAVRAVVPEREAVSALKSALTAGTR
jgi:hypothetical protein